MKVGDQHLGVKRIQAQEHEIVILEEYKKWNNSRVLVLTNLIVASEMRDEQDYDDIAEDTEEEMKRYGKIIRTVVPKPGRGTAKSAIGKVYIQFEKKESAELAKEKMMGRRFEGRVVDAQFYDEDMFLKEEFE